MIPITNRSLSEDHKRIKKLFDETGSNPTLFEKLATNLKKNISKRKRDYFLNIMKLLEVQSNNSDHFERT